MASLVFQNLMDAKIFNNRRIAIYFLNNFSSMHDSIDLDQKDFIKNLIGTGFISESEIKEDVIRYFYSNLKDKPYVQKLIKEHFVHKPNTHVFKL